MSSNLVLLTLIGSDDQVKEMTLGPKVGRRRVPGRQGDALDRFWCRLCLLRQESRERWRDTEVVLLDPSGLTALHRLRCHTIVQREAGQDSLNSIGAVSSSADELTDPDNVDTCLLFRIRILDKMYFGIGTQPLDLRDCDKVVDAFAVKLEVEARVLKRVRKLDYCLSDLVDLLLGRDLEHRGE